MICIETVQAGPLYANCYLLSLPNRDDCVVIDPGGSDAVEAAWGSGKTVAAVIATHGHFDHIGGVEALCRSGVPFYLGAGDSLFLSDPVLNASGSFGTLLTVPVQPRLLREQERVTLAGIPFQVLETPGHTPGSVCLIAEDALFTGDTLFAGGFGRTDLPLGSGADLRRSIRKLLRDLPGDYTVYPGHGRQTTMETERQYY